MKYLIQHTKELIISLGVFVTVGFILYKGFKEGSPIDNVIESVFVVLGWYYNMPTSEENSEATGLMREKKKQKDEDYVGETYDE